MDAEMGSACALKWSHKEGCPAAFDIISLGHASYEALIASLIRPIYSVCRAVSVVPALIFRQTNTFLAELPSQLIRFGLTPHEGGYLQQPRGV